MQHIMNCTAAGWVVFHKLQRGGSNWLGGLVNKRQGSLEPCTHQQAAVAGCSCWSGPAFCMMHQSKVVLHC